MPTTSSGIRVRTRTCSTPDSCTAWVAGSQPNMFQLDGAQAPSNVRIPASGLASTFALGFLDDGRPAVMSYGVAPVEGSSASVSLALQCFPAGPVADGSAPLALGACIHMLDDKPLQMTGTDSGSTALVGAHCAQLIQRRTDGGIQRENVFFARY